MLQSLLVFYFMMVKTAATTRAWNHRPATENVWERLKESLLHVEPVILWPSLEGASLPTLLLAPQNHFAHFTIQASLSSSSQPPSYNTLPHPPYIVHNPHSHRETHVHFIEHPNVLSSLEDNTSYPPQSAFNHTLLLITCIVPLMQICKWFAAHCTRWNP